MVDGDGDGDGGWQQRATRQQHDTTSPTLLSYLLLILRSVLMANESHG